MDKRMRSPVKTSLLELVNVLLEMHKQKDSYLVHISNTHKEAGRFVLKDGEITFISFNSIRGSDAIAVIKNESTLQYRIGRHLPMPVSKSLPSTVEIISFLGGSTITSTPKQSAQIRQEAPTVATTTSGLSEQQQEAFKKVLSDIVGPMADIFVADYVAHAADFNDALFRLRVELSADDVQFVRDEVKKHL